MVDVYDVIGASEWTRIEIDGGEWIEFPADKTGLSEYVRLAIPFDLGGSIVHLPLLTMAGTGGPYPDQGTLGRHLATACPNPTNCLGTGGYTLTVDGYHDLEAPSLTMTGTGVTGHVGETTNYNSLPALTSDGQGAGNELADSEITLPIFQMDPETSMGLSGMVAAGEIDLPPPTLLGDGITGFMGSGEMELPGWQVEASEIGGMIVLSPFTMSGEGVAGAAGQADLDFPDLEIEANGLAQAFGAADLYLPMWEMGSPGLTEFLGISDLSLPPFQLYALGAAGEVGQASLTLPLLTANASGFTDGLEGITSLTLPMVLVEAFGSPEIADQPVSNVVVMNLSNTAITQYSNYGFTGYFSFQGHNYGVNATGIYLLEGLDDNGTYINVDIQKTGIDQQSPLLKRATDAYLKFRATGDFKFTMIYDEKSQDYMLNNGVIGLRTLKLHLGKGGKGRTLGFTFTNHRGSYFKLNEIRLILELLSRRARDV